MKKPKIVLTVSLLIPVLMSVGMFVTKLMRYHDWSWFWVFAPVIAAAVLTALFAVAYVTFLVFMLRALVKDENF